LIASHFVCSSKFNKTVESVALLLLLALIAPVGTAWTALILISKIVTIPSIRASACGWIHVNRWRLREGEATIIIALLTAQIIQVD
jgi:hypothetical protein